MSHGSVGMVQKSSSRDMTGFGMYGTDFTTFKNVAKSGFGQSVCVCVSVCVCMSVCVCLSVLLLPFPRTLTGVRVNRSS